MLPKHQLVKVEWDDAEDPKGGWQDEKEVAEFASHQSLVTSYGIVVSDTEKYLTLAADWIADLKHYGRITKIAVAQIIKVEAIEG